MPPAEGLPFASFGVCAGCGVDVAFGAGVVFRASLGPELACSLACATTGGQRRVVVYRVYPSAVPPVAPVPTPLGAGVLVGCGVCGVAVQAGGRCSVCGSLWPRAAG